MPLFGGFNMTATMTKQDKVLSYLSKGRTLSADSAYNMFGVANLRATISDIKNSAHSLGFNVVRSVGRHGETRYGFSPLKKKR
jgi:hypothetical protein